MHIHCPNCQSSFDVSPERIPSPKFNTAYSSFGWKFECGNCDSQWWVCVNTPHEGEDLHGSYGKRQSTIPYQSAPVYPSFGPNAMPYHMKNTDIASHSYPHVQGDTRIRQGAQKFSTGTSFPNQQSPIAEHDQGFGQSRGRGRKMTPSLRLSASPDHYDGDHGRLVASSRYPWRLLAWLVALCTLILACEYWYPIQTQHVVRMLSWDNLKTMDVQRFKTQVNTFFARPSVSTLPVSADLSTAAVGTTPGMMPFTPTQPAAAKAATSTVALPPSMPPAAGLHPLPSPH